MPRTIRFEWEGKVFEIGVERVGDRLTLTHGDKRYIVTVLPGSSESRFAPSPASTQLPPAAGSRVDPLQASTTGAVTPAFAAASTASGPTAELDAAGALHAPMTGVIKEIKVAPGHNVERGQVVLIMEAMKMDIDVPSPASGVVAEVLVKVGDTVSARQKLMMIH